MEDFEQDRDTRVHLDARGKWLICCKENNSCALFFAYVIIKLDHFVFEWLIALEADMTNIQQKPS